MRQLLHDSLLSSGESSASQRDDTRATPVRVGSRPKDFNTKADFKSFYRIVKMWFKMYFQELGPEDLAWHQGRVLIAIWSVQEGFHDAPPNFFAKVNKKLEKHFGFQACWTTSPAWQLQDPDELNTLFWGRDAAARFNDQDNADLRVGFWPIWSAETDLFQARNAGETYKKAWEGVIGSASKDCEGRASPSLVLIESYKEYQEGSGIYPARCMKYPNKKAHVGIPNVDVCADTPCITHELKDRWAPKCSKPRAPFRYLDISRTMIRKLHDKLRRSAADRCDDSGGRQ